MAFRKREVHMTRPLRAPTTMKKPRRITLITNDCSGTTTTKLDPTRPRTNFLSLPHEIRQSILIYARPEHDTWNGERELIHARAAVWKEVHPDIKEDVEYAKKKWLEMLTEKLQNSCYRNWKFLWGEERAVSVHFGKQIWLSQTIGAFTGLNGMMRELLGLV